MTNPKSIFEPMCDIMPIRRGIQLRCTYPAFDCPLVEMNNWMIFNYKINLSPESTSFDMTINAPGTMDNQITQHLYGFATNVCRACIARRQQNAL